MGDAARFNQIESEYRRAPGVTRERLYLETMERVLAKSNKVIIDGKGVTAPVVLPPDVFQRKAAAASDQSAEAAPAQAQPPGQAPAADQKKPAQ
jgi:membrane protease subunit HflK